MIRRKGLHILIDAIKELNMEHDDIYLIAGGKETDYLNDCLQFAKLNGVNNVIYVGMINPMDRKSFYLDSDVFVLPSFFEDGSVEAWGLTINEALECNTPVVSTTAVGAAYDMLDGHNGIMVKVLWSSVFVTLRPNILPQGYATP